MVSMRSGAGCKTRLGRPPATQHGFHPNDFFIYVMCDKHVLFAVLYKYQLFSMLTECTSNVTFPYIIHMKVCQVCNIFHCLNPHYNVHCTFMQISQTLHSEFKVRQRITIFILRNFHISIYYTKNSCANELLVYQVLDEQQIRQIKK